MNISPILRKNLQIIWLLDREFLNKLKKTNLIIGVNLIQLTAQILKILQNIILIRLQNPQLRNSILKPIKLEIPKRPKLLKQSRDMRKLIIINIKCVQTRQLKQRRI